jgi:hypothetical protein
MGQLDDRPLVAFSLVAVPLTLQWLQQSVVQRNRIRCNIDAPDAVDVHAPALTCGFVMAGVCFPAMSPTGIPCGFVIALLGECCIGCNSTHLPVVDEGVPSFRTPRVQKIGVAIRQGPSRL